MASSKKGKDQFVFVTNNGLPFSNRTLHKVVVRSSERAGVKRISFHGLRHTFATIIANSHGVEKACILLGHSDIKITMMYYHADQTVLQNVIINQ